jgi:adenylate cyclase
MDPEIPGFKRQARCFSGQHSELSHISKAAGRFGRAGLDSAVDSFAPSKEARAPVPKWWQRLVVAVMISSSIALLVIGVAYCSEIFRIAVNWSRTDNSFDTSRPKFGPDDTLAFVADTALNKVSETIRSAEYWTRDLRVSVLGPDRPVRKDIVVLAIDEKTLDTLPYRSPVDRGFLKEVLDKLAASDVRAVGIDILFDHKTEPAKDAAFFEALHAFPKPLIVVWGDADEQEQIITEDQKRYMDEHLAGITKGYANILRDQNETVRWINVRHEEGKEDIPGFPAAIALALGQPIPSDNIAIDYILGPDHETQAFPTFSASTAKFLPKQWFAGKIVLIGAVLRERDRYPTPLVAGFGPSIGVIPGIVIHAHALAQILDGRELDLTGVPAEVAIVAGTALLGAMLAALTIPIWTMMLAGSVIFFAIILSIFAIYYEMGTVLPVITPSLGFVLALLAMSFHQQRRFHEERTFIRGALSRYVAEDVVKQLEHEPWRLKLGGERRTLTYLFTDIAGFTSLSEETEPTVLVAALNRYLDGASRVVLENGGTIDKYIGDAIVVVFGAFGAQDSHEIQAVRCAMALDRYARKFAAEQRAAGMNFGDTRIGVNTGSAIIGNFGGDLRFDYTSIGDTVNTAARLEGANKYFGTRVCVSGTTLAACKEIAVRYIGNIVLKGKTESLPVGQPVSEDDPAFAWVEKYNAAYSVLEKRDPGAVQAFAELAQLAPDDPLVNLHRKRLQNGETGTEIVLDEK